MPAAEPAAKSRLPKPGGAALKSDPRFQSLTAAIFDGVCITQGGRIMEVNEPFIAMFRCRREDVVGREVMTFVDPESRDTVLQRMLSGAEGLYEHRARRWDGTTFDVEVQAKSIEWEGQTVRVSAVRDITERKRTEAALQESRARLELIFQNTADMLVLYAVEWLPDGSPDIRLVTVNRAFLEGAALVGFPVSLEAVRGRRYDELMREIFDRDDATIAESNAQFREAIAARRPMSWVDERVWPGGRYALERTEIPIFDEGGTCRHILRVLHNVTEQRQMQEALRASEQRFRSYFELPIVGVAISSPTQIWLTVNNRLCEMLGYAQDELVGHSWRNVTHPDDLPGNLALFDRMAAGEIDGYTLEKRFRHKDGRDVPTALSTRCARRPDGKLDYLVTLIQDISERKEAEAERAAALAREQQARMGFTRKLIASQEAERRRIASELHDSLGQNLLLIKNRAQLAQAAAPGSTDLAEQLAGIVQLAVGAIAEVRQISHDLRPYQLDQLGLTRALRAMIDGAAQATGLAFEVTLESVDEVFSADNAIHLYRIVQECLNNILNHARATRVQLVLERDLHEIRLQIVDNGCGLARPQAAALAESRGFGLQNMAERVQILGGRLTLESPERSGLAVRIIIPVAEPA
jgi:PAS domain S-box-containing protein